MRRFTLRRGLFGANHLTGIPEPIDMRSNKTNTSAPFFDNIMVNTNNIDDSHNSQVHWMLSTKHIYP